MSDRHAITPEVDADSALFWEDLHSGALLLPRCMECARCFFPPIPSCPYCGSSNVGTTHGSGLGRIYSWATIHVALHPAFAADVPYTVVVVELDEGPRIFGRLLDNS